MKVAPPVSTHRHRIPVKIALFAILVAFAGLPGRALAQIPGVDQWSEALVAGLTPHWAGQRVPHPMVSTRPLDSHRYLSSEYELIRVHGDENTSEEKMRQVLRIAESALVSLRSQGWGVPAEDGGLGGSTEFDIYVGAVPEKDFDVRSDGSLLWPHLDTDSSFAFVDENLEGRDLNACVTQAYAESLLLGVDPAEAPGWRTSTATYLTYQLTGSFGCHEDKAVEGIADAFQMAIPDRTVIAEGRDASAAGYFVGLLDAQERGGDGTFIRDMWQLTRQRTWEGADLRGSPDLWMAIEATLGFQDRKMADLLEQITVGRFLAGTSGAPNHGYRALMHVEPHLIGEATFADLPETFTPVDPPIEAYGQGFAVLHTPNVPANTRLRVWMHGEFRVEWDLIVVPLDRMNHELTRISAPPRRNPRSYLETVIPADTDRVLIVVTNMSHRLPDADIVDDNARSFQLILDR